VTSWKINPATRFAARGIVKLLDRRERANPRARAPSSCWALTSARLWERAPEDARRALGERLVVRSHPARAHVLIEDAGELVHVLVSGGAKLYRTSSSGRKLVEALLVPGDVFGRIVSDGAGERVAIEPLEPTEIGAIPRDVFDAVIKRHPEFAYEVVQHVEDRSRLLARRLEALAFKDVETRLAETLVALAHEHESLCEHGFAVDVRLSQSDLAELVGASRQMVNRVLGKLERQLLVQRVGRVICILHLERLERFACSSG
jgi:CRP/FNR family transcriptional regulator, cyclic AMP receptor protein